MERKHPKLGQLAADANLNTTAKLQKTLTIPVAKGRKLLMPAPECGVAHGAPHQTQPLQ